MENSASIVSITMEDVSGNIQGAVRGEIYWNSQGDINWSGFFGNDDSGDELSPNNIVGYKETSEHGYRGIYKGDCIKERVALTSTQIFCADTNEVCVFLFFFFRFVFEWRENKRAFKLDKVKSENPFDYPWFQTPLC